MERTAIRTCRLLMLLLPPVCCVCDISRWRSYESADAVSFHIFAHVDPHQRLVVVEQELSQSLCQLGLA